MLTTIKCSSLTLSLQVLESFGSTSASRHFTAYYGKFKQLTPASSGIYFLFLTKTMEQGMANTQNLDDFI